jgi:hypothetical protein
MLHNKPHDPTDLALSEAAIGYKRHRIEPELGHLPLTLHVDVRRFSTVGTEEENETVRSIPMHGGHMAVYRAHMILYSRTTFYGEKRQGATKA